MRRYLSMGFGVNSVAMYLLLLEQGETPGDPEQGFDAVFVDHGTDWPETYEYAARFMERYPVTVITPEVKDNSGNIYTVLFDYYRAKCIIPVKMGRMCTDKFKMRPLRKYMLTPYFQLLGIDADESHRAKPAYEKGAESRWPLLEAEPPLSREDCKALILRHGLEVPPKSGCWLCPFQPPAEWRRLRREHPELYCKARRLEEDYAEKRLAAGQAPLWLAEVAPLEVITREGQGMLPGLGMEYPPCSCGL